jgi:hypothetical protein
MYEKYNAYEVGVGGGGGEYTPQIGFGWSNGVALVLLNSTASIVDDDATDTSNGSNSNKNNAIIISVSVVCVVVFVSIVGVIAYLNRDRFSDMFKKQNRSNSRSNEVVGMEESLNPII